MNLPKTYKKKKIQTDIFSKNKAYMYENLFKVINSKSKLNKNKNLPFGWHWLYFPEDPPLHELGLDGHIKRGNFLPIFKGCKRMCAGSEIVFKKHII